MPRPIPSDISNRSFDAIIVGAGINGAGIARDAAMRGLKVLLLDKGDLAGGTSSWSTRLIHGGLRYLEYGEVGLVRESLRERETLLRIAPHLVQPLPLIVPIYQHGARSKTIIRAGMVAYDVLSFDKSLPRHRILSRAETLARVPELNGEGLKGAAVYHDAQVEFAERLVVENALSAREHGATVLTYARVDELLLEKNRVAGVKFTDVLRGESHRARAPVTINVAGPWVDEVLRNLAPSIRRMIGGTKGSHIVVDRFDGAPRAALYVEARADRRPFFIIPWNDKLLIGTTDLPYEGDLDVVQASTEEIDYLIRETNHVIPAARLTRDSILFTYSGVRPLPFIAEERDARGITRRHFIHDHAPEVEGLLSIIGGKLTTYRELAEQIVDALFRKLGRKRLRPLTAHAPLPGANVEDFKTFAASFVADSGLVETTARRLLRIYGTRASSVLKLAAEHASLKESFDAESGAIGAEVLLSFRDEMAETLSDCLMRRTMVGFGRKLGLAAASQAASVAQKHLGWDERRAAREIAAYHDYVKRLRCGGLH